MAPKHTGFTERYDLRTHDKPPSNRPAQARSRPPLTSPTLGAFSNPWANPIADRATGGGLTNEKRSLLNPDDLKRRAETTGHTLQLLLGDLVIHHHGQADHQFVRRFLEDVDLQAGG